MLKIKCNTCDRELDVPGALLFSPPDEDNNCVKIHICVVCFDEMMCVKESL